MWPRPASHGQDIVTVIVIAMFARKGLYLLPQAMTLGKDTKPKVTALNETFIVCCAEGKIVFTLEAACQLTTIQCPQFISRVYAVDVYMCPTIHF